MTGEIRQDLRARLQDRLNDPELTVIGKGVSDRTVRRLHDSLLNKMPEPELESFLNRGTKIVIGDRDFCNEKTGCSKGIGVAGWFKAGIQKERSSPWIYPGEEVEYEQHQIAIVNNSLRDMEWALIHEIGHDRAFCNQERNFNSAVASDYGYAVDDYMAMRRNSGEKSVVRSMGESSFQDHIRADVYETQENAVYNEHSAEMYAKFIIRAGDYDRKGTEQSRREAFMKSDLVMEEDYGQSWLKCKEEVFPSLGEFIDENNKELGQEVRASAHAAFVKASDRSFYSQIKNMGADVLGKIKDTVLGRKEQPVMWKQHDHAFDGLSMECDVSDMSRHQQIRIANGLREEGVSFRVRYDDNKMPQAYEVTNPLSIARLDAVRLSSKQNSEAVRPTSGLSALTT